MAILGTLAACHDRCGIAHPLIAGPNHAQRHQAPLFVVRVCVLQHSTRLGAALLASRHQPVHPEKAQSSLFPSPHFLMSWLAKTSHLLVPTIYQSLHCQRQTCFLAMTAAQPAKARLGLISHCISTWPRCPKLAFCFLLNLLANMASILILLLFCLIGPYR